LKCKKCLEDGKVIKSTLSGTCTALTSICAANEVFIREAVGLGDDSNHLGSCESSSICVTFDYSNNRGFDLVASGENLCIKC